MALNPLLDQRGYPQLFPQEVVVVIYPGVYGGLHLENEMKIRSQGTLYLSNARLIFVTAHFTHQHFNFALHLNLISRENPVYINSALTYFEGYTLPYGNFMPCPGTFKFEMTQDPRPFLLHLTRFLQQIRASNLHVLPPNNPPNRPQPVQPPPRTVGNEAYVDPNDPDILII